MNPQPDGRTKFLEDAEDMSRRQTALNDVIVISDPITPPKKLSSLTYAVKLVDAQSLELTDLTCC